MDNTVVEYVEKPRRLGVHFAELFMAVLAQLAFSFSQNTKVSPS